LVFNEGGDALGDESGVGFAAAELHDGADEFAGGFKFAFAKGLDDIGVCIEGMGDPVIDLSGVRNLGEAFLLDDGVGIGTGREHGGEDVVFCGGGGERAGVDEGDESGEVVRGDFAGSEGRGGLIEGAEEIIADPVGGGFGGGAGGEGGFEIVGEGALGGENSGVVGGEAEGGDEAVGTVGRRFWERGAEGGDVLGGEGHGDEIGVGEVAVVMSFFF